MIGFRNIAIHTYFAVDFANVWQIASHSLLELNPQVQQILDDLGGLPPLEIMSIALLLFPYLPAFQHAILIWPDERHLPSFVTESYRSICRVDKNRRFGKI